MALSHLTTLSALLATFNAIAHAIPNPVAAAAPQITPFQAELRPTPTLKRRENILSKIEGDVTSVLSALGSGIPAYVASGVPNFFQDFPTGDKVQSSLGIDGAQLAALPTQVLNIPPYGNWTNDGWQIRFRGNVCFESILDPTRTNKYRSTSSRTPTRASSTPWPTSSSLEPIFKIYQLINKIKPETLQPKSSLSSKATDKFPCTSSQLQAPAEMESLVEVAP